MKTNEINVQQSYIMSKYMFCFSISQTDDVDIQSRIRIIMEMCTAPTLRLKALNKHTHMEKILRWKMLQTN